MVPSLRSEHRGETPDQQQHRHDSQRISPNWRRQLTGPNPSRGLFNPISECYQNSVLFSLLHAPKFVNLLETHSCQTIDCIGCALRDLSLAYWAEGEDEDALQDEMTNALAWFRTILPNSGWTATGQQDAQHFYNHVIEELQNDCPLEAAAIRSTILLTTVRTSICRRRNCGNVYSRPSDAATALSLATGGRSAYLKTLIKEEFASATRNGDCDDCGRYGSRRHTIRIHKAPHILVIHIARFDYQNKRPIKLKDFVYFGEYQTLTHYQESTSRLHYRLRSVVQHGGSLNGGHYVTVVRGPHGNWMEMNDDQPVNGVRLTDAQSLGGKWTSYLLFFEKEESFLPGEIAAVAAKEFFDGQAAQLRSAERAMGAGNKRKRT